MTRFDTTNSESLEFKQYEGATLNLRERERGGRREGETQREGAGGGATRDREKEGEREREKESQRRPTTATERRSPSTPCSLLSFPQVSTTVHRGSRLRNGIQLRERPGGPASSHSGVGVGANGRRSRPPLQAESPKPRGRQSRTSRAAEGKDTEGATRSPARRGRKNVRETRTRGGGSGRQPSPGSWEEDDDDDEEDEEDGSGEEEEEDEEEEEEWGAGRSARGGSGRSAGGKNRSQKKRGYQEEEEEGEEEEEEDEEEEEEYWEVVPPQGFRYGERGSASDQLAGNGRRLDEYGTI